MLGITTFTRIVSIPKKGVIPFEQMTDETYCTVTESFNPQERGNTVRTLFVVEILAVLLCGFNPQERGNTVRTIKVGFIMHVQHIVSIPKKGVIPFERRILHCDLVDIDRFQSPRKG